MKLKLLTIALLSAGFVSTASARVYDSARFVPVGDGSVELLGFGRGASSLLGAQSASSFASASSQTNFFDTWNIDVSLVAPGTYSFEDWLIEATGGLRFGTSGFSVVLNSIDDNGVRNSVFFEVTDLGKKATGSGTFTVRSQCPIASCVWIDLTGTQEAGSSSAGYGGTSPLIAGVVPEPASYGLMGLGLVLVGAAARRRRGA